MADKKKEGIYFDLGKENSKRNYKENAIENIENIDIKNIDDEEDLRRFLRGGFEAK